MENKDTFQTITKKSEGLYKDKGSKFISLAHPVTNENEIKRILEEIRSKYHDARHHCYAYRLGYNMKDGKEIAYRINDDGEPRGTAGLPIYNQLLSYKTTNILLVVVRYFGGTKLGVPGLINAYKESAQDCLQNCTIVEQTLRDIFVLAYPYKTINTIMGIIKKNKIEIINNELTESCLTKISVRKKDSEKIFDLFNKINTLEINYL